MDPTEEVARESSNDSSEDSSHGQDCPEYNALRDTTPALCRALPIKNLIPDLIGAGVIDFEDGDELREGNYRDRKVTELFISKHLSRSLALGDTSKFKKFMKVIQQSGKCHNDKLFKRIKQRIEHHRRQFSG